MCCAVEQIGGKQMWTFTLSAWVSFVVRFLHRQSFLGGQASNRTDLIGRFGGRRSFRNPDRTSWPAFFGARYPKTTVSIRGFSLEKPADAPDTRSTSTGQPPTMEICFSSKRASDWFYETTESNSTSTHSGRKARHFSLQIYQVGCYAFDDSLLWLVKENCIAISMEVIWIRSNEACWFLLRSSLKHVQLSSPSVHARIITLRLETWLVHTAQWVQGIE